MILSRHDSVAQRSLPVAPSLKVSLRLMGHVAHFCRHVYHARSMKKNAPSGGPGRGVEERTDNLKLVNEVQREGDHILFSGRQACCGVGDVVRPITRQTVIPTDLNAANHVCPKRIINRAREAEEFGIVACGSRSVPKTIAGGSVFGPPVELELFS